MPTIHVKAMIVLTSVLCSIIVGGCLARYTFWLCHLHRMTPPPTEKSIIDWSVTPIDAVYTWVNGEDPAHQALRIKHHIPNDKAHFRDHNELQLSINSMAKFAPWVRTIHILCADYQIPDLSPLPMSIKRRIRCVPHSRVLDPANVPTFNSNAIETAIHKIPGCAEHFIYFNDDMLLANHVRPDDFFTPYGCPYYFSRLSLDYTFHWLHRWLKAGRLPRFNRTINAMIEAKVATKLRYWRLFKKPIHQCYPLTRRLGELCWQNKSLKKVLKETQAYSYRHPDACIPIFLMQLMGIIRGEMIPCNWTNEWYVNLDGSERSLRRLVRGLNKKPKLLCVNTASSDNDDTYITKWTATLISYSS